MDWYILAFLSAIFSAIAAVLQKKVLFDLDALEFSFLLGLCNALIVLFILPQLNYSNISSVGLIILYFKTILGAFAFWNVMLAIKNMEISGALPLMVLTPGFVAIFSFILLGEVITNIELLGMVLLLVGTFILEIKNRRFLEPLKVFIKSKYHRYILYALILFTISSVVDKLLLRDFKFEPTTFVVFQQIFLAINFSIIVIVKSKNIKKIFSAINYNVLAWIGIISILTITYRYLQIEAVKIAPVALVLSIKRTSVFFASVFGGHLFKEHNLTRKTIAIIVMLIGAYLLT